MRYALGRSVQHGLGQAGYRLVPSGGRAATVLDDDRLIVSYPRSGNTWLSFLLTNLTHPEEPTTFLNLQQRCPDIHQRSDRYLRRISRPRLMKSHEAFDGRYPRVLYLARDPRDVVVSYRRFLAKTRTISDGLSLTEFVDGFLEGKWDGERGSWGEHAGSWLGARRSDDSFLVLRYEDLHRDTRSQLQRVAEFLGISGSEEAISRAVQLSNSARMREMENTQGSQVPELKVTRLDIPFVGAAEIGRGQRELDEADEARILDRWSAVMAEFGYLGEA